MSLLNLLEHPDPDEAEADITKEEIIAAMQKMKRRKTPVVDLLTLEVITAGGDKMIDVLHKICNAVWRDEETPKDFSKMVVYSYT